MKILGLMRKIIYSLTQLVILENIIDIHTQKLIFFSEPLKLSLGKTYLLNVIKEITVTDSFLSMNKETSGCQKEPFNDCISRKFKDILLTKCKCLPFQMRLSDEVFPLIKN